MSMTNRTESDGFSIERISPWPFAFRVTLTASALLLALCFAFPNG
ncbi:hypothetical protein [Stappia taiwanensis]|nr:hypothetical protein [Stappia taiwanensis]